MIPYHNKEWLYNQYIINEKSTLEIAKICNVSKTPIIKWIKRFKIPMRSLSEARKLAIKKGKLDSCLYKKGHTKCSGEKHPMYGKHLKEETKDKLSKLNHADKSPAWKGNDAKHHSFHCWLRNNIKKPNLCEKCKKEKKLDFSFDHTLGDYTRDPKDYKSLCRKCHFKRDKKLKRDGLFVKAKN
jgi:predicted DNA-binding protein YlxM (UPF0122 family)